MNRIGLKALIIGIMLIWLVIGLLLTPVVGDIMSNLGTFMRPSRWSIWGYVFFTIILALIVVVVFVDRVKEMFDRFVKKMHLKALAIGIVLIWWVTYFLLSPWVTPFRREIWGDVSLAIILTLVAGTVFVGRVEEIWNRFVAGILLVFHSFPALAWVMEPALYVMVIPVGIFALLCSPTNLLFVFPSTRRLLGIVILSSETHGLAFLLRVCLNLLGICLFSLGVVIFSVALIQLLKGKGGLVTSGLYSVVRHPQYLGIILATLGFTFFEIEVKLISLIAWIMLVFAYVWLARREESNLEKRYGEEFLAYKRRVHFILPSPIPTRKK